MTAENLATFLAGLIAPIIIQWLKGSKIADKWALWLAVFVSIVLAAVASLATGGIPAADQFAVRAAAVMAVSQLIWRQFLKPELEPI
ncbi:MAG: hypothetical protein ACYC4L_11375 [Chloroflexota bacterium]